MSAIFGLEAENYKLGSAQFILKTPIILARDTCGMAPRASFCVQITKRFEHYYSFEGPGEDLSQPNGGQPGIRQAGAGGDRWVAGAEWRRQDNHVLYGCGADQTGQRRCLSE